ncbi:MAG: VWA domain-containing protein [Erysipelotrichaceae bacterium]|nr:VWA domain-containing protein [Erysipelotrichaceae bacterium]
MKKENNRITEVVFVLDRSGSMHDLVEDTIGGFNSVLSQQREKEGRAFITTMLFNDKFRYLHDHLDIHDVADITREDYFTSGCTALYDAIGQTISKMDGIVTSEKDAGVLMVIITDGLENSSREFEGGRIRKMIEARKEKGWEFLFLGANIDSFAVSGKLGIDRSRTANWHADARGVEVSYGTLNTIIGNFRQCSAMEAEQAINL